MGSLPKADKKSNITQVVSAFRAVRTGPQPLAALTFTRVLYTTERLDTNNEYNTATGEFIPQQSGIYSFIASAEFFPTTPGQIFFLQLFIRVNGVSVASEFTFSTGRDVVTSVSTIVQLQAGDVVDVLARSSVSGNINNFSTVIETRFEGARIS
ncbi:C1q-like domain-containing protein [Desmospora profundinema]|uniref:C1q domain-containing protein n=1 Tax=Desmospora profundinema TaxID=1571184 RepID=A0ABU1IHU8_9BACL|nr:ABC transporter permease [Desmospora profundinema]MDR6224352.1 hypothetical protein [Desmospora profundinema]